MLESYCDAEADCGSRFISNKYAAKKFGIQFIF